MFFILLLTITCFFFFFFQSDGRTTVKRGMIESFQIKKSLLSQSHFFFLEKNDVFTYFWQIVNIIHQLWWLSVQQVGRWIGCWGSFNRHEFRKNRQLLWDIPTPGEDVSGENNDFMGLSSWQKLLFGMEGTISICWLMTDCTIETHTYYRGKFLSMDFQCINTNFSMDTFVQKNLIS